MSVSGHSVSDSEIVASERQSEKMGGKEGKIYRESVREETNNVYSYTL